MTEPDTAYIQAGGNRLAYRKREGGRSPNLLFLPGYASDMDGSKAVAIDKFAHRHDIGCLRFDYSGTGLSEGDFANGTLGRWIEEAIAVTDQLARGPLILVGSSMGAWVAFHLALRTKAQIVGVVGISAAPDFTDWGFDPAEREAIVRDGAIGPKENPVHRCFWESGQSLLLLDGEIAVDCPVRLVHGEKDKEVPLEVPRRLISGLRSADVQLTIVKDGGHRLSEPREIRAITNVIGGLLEQHH
jgi:pimeloyl-ACP methyl ester carboxylesterase